MALRDAQAHRIKTAQPTIDALEAKTFRELTEPNALTSAIEARHFDDPTPNQSFLLMAALSAGFQPYDPLRLHAARIASWQQPDGHWSTSDFRPPHSYSLFTATASALIVINAYGPSTPAIRTRAREWLTLNEAHSTEDSVFRLLGMQAAGAGEREIEAATDDLLARQLPSGGWPQIEHYPADAYSTGEAIYALNQLATAQPAQRRGIRFLLNTQAQDGTWHTHTRMVSPANVSPEYFKTGYPYGHDEFLSFTGACWATRALLTAIPAPPSIPVPLIVTARAPPSLEGLALFGTESALRAELDRAGWNANLKSDSDLTPLMLAAGPVDAEAKVRLLLSRGADPRARTKSGTDALIIAASYRGNSAVLKRLLDAGAEPNLPKDSKLKNSALDFASMSGDLDAVNLLLVRGADPNAGTPLSHAITFGHTDVVEALINAGAETGLVESTGVNLLHWATITNRPGAIPLLAKAKVPINAVDDNGFTPLHYAASIDFGDTQVLDALLAAGANPKELDFNNRTPLQQAFRLRHANLAKALRRSAK
jgi:ankyrin repeat protein